MSKTLVVFGATGQQGGSVVNYVSQDLQLSRDYKIRAITRDVNSDKARSLKDKAEVVYGDVQDRSSLEAALTDAHTIFAVTNPSFAPDGLEVEYNIAKTIADIAVEKSASYIIFSTLPPVKEISSGKYTKSSHFDAKAKAEQYIRGLTIKSAFISAGFYMENFQGIPFLGPQKLDESTWAISWANSPTAEFPMFSATEDTGKFVGAILAEPSKYEGQVFCAATALYTLEEAADAISRATGKKVIYKQLSRDDFKQSLPFAGDIFDETFAYGEEFGYYGPDSKKLVTWAAENARDKPTTLEAFLKAHPLELK